MSTKVIVGLFAIGIYVKGFIGYTLWVELEASRHLARLGRWVKRSRRTDDDFPRATVRRQ